MGKQRSSPQQGLSSLCVVGNPVISYNPPSSQILPRTSLPDSSFDARELRCDTGAGGRGEGVLAKEVGRADGRVAPGCPRRCSEALLCAFDISPPGRFSVLLPALIQSLNFHQFKGDQHIWGWALAATGRDVMLCSQYQGYYLVWALVCFELSVSFC